MFVTHAFTIPAKYNRTFKLGFFGDVHRDSPNHAHRTWQAFLERARAEPDTYWIGMGDYVDSGSASERACITSVLKQLHESTTTDMAILAEAKVELLARELGFMRGRLIGLLNGNHYFEFQDGTNTDQKLCAALRCKYLGVSAFIRLTINCSNRCHTLDIWTHHGKGGARLLGGSINRVDQMREYADADFYVMGHDHKLLAVPATPRLFLHTGNGANKMKVCQRQSWLVRSGSFLASYEDGKSNYNVDAARGPSSLGNVEFTITPRCHWIGSASSRRAVWDDFEIHGVT